LARDLKENGDELQCLEILNQTLIRKERAANAELQDARKALIQLRLQYAISECVGTCDRLWSVSWIVD